MLQSTREGSWVPVVRSLVEIGVIRFPMDFPVSLNFRPKDMASIRGPLGLLTSEHMHRIGEKISNTDEQMCRGCHGVVGIPYAGYPNRWANEGSPLVIAFAKRWAGMTPLGFHQVKAKASSEAAYKVLVVDTFPCGNLDPVEEAIDTLCGMSVEVVGAVTFLKDDGQERLCGRPLSSVFTPTTLLEFCHKHKLVPLNRREAIDYYLRTRH